MEQLRNFFWLGVLIVFHSGWLTFDSAGATHYVRAGASGNGTDWANAFGGLPATLVRGDIYYIADGNYSAFKRSEPNSGSLRIVIKKAIESDHGTDSGWNASYGDGQAVFVGSGTHAHSISGEDSDYWTIDGQQGDYYRGIPYGIAFVTDDNRSQVLNWGVTSKSGSHSVLRFVEIAGHGRNTTNDFPSPYQTAGLTSWGGATNVLVSNCYVHGAATLIDAVPYWTIEYCVLKDSRADSDPNGAHSNIFYCGYGAHDIVFRFNKISNFNDEGFFITGYNGSPRNIWAYGNIFYSPGTRYSRAFDFRVNFNYTNIFVYNNTIVDMTLYGIANNTAQSGNITVNCKVENNLLYRASISLGDISMQSSNLVVATDPFVDLSNRDFRLKSGIRGVALPPPFNLDWDQKIRGSDGTWDVGAFEFTSGSVPPLPDTNAPSAFVSSPASGANVEGLVLVRAIASDDSNGSGVASIALKVDGNLIGSGSSSPLEVSWNSASVSNGIHVVVAEAIDLAGNTGISDSLLVFVQNDPDTNAPTVTLSVPLPNGVVSNLVTLTAIAVDEVAGSGIERVEFLVDGLVIGTDETLPYSINWNSATVLDGSHTVQARARDIAGNENLSAGVVVSVSNSAGSLSAGLVGWWRFEEKLGTTASDSSGNGNAGVLVSAPRWGRGLMGACLTFDGTNGYVRIPSSPTLESITNALTISCWVFIQKNNSMQTVARKVISESVNDYPFSAYDLVLVDNGTSFVPRFGVSRSDSVRGLAYGLLHSYDRWYHLAGTYDGGTLRIYVNGVEEGSAAFAGSLLQTSQPLCIGRYGEVTESVKGQIDDFRLYSRCLAFPEILALSRQPAAVPGARFISP